METPNAGSTQSADPFWFLENVDNPEARLAQANYTNDGQQTQEMENWYTDKSNPEEKSPRESNKLEDESSASKQATDQSKPDSDSISDLERSLFGENKEKTAKTVETPKDSEKQSTVHGLSNNRTTINLDLKDLIGQQKNPKIIIKVNESANGQHSGEERIIEIDASRITKELLLSGIPIGNGDKSEMPTVVGSKQPDQVDANNKVSSYSENIETDIDSLLSDQKAQTFGNYVYSDVVNTQESNNKKPKPIFITVKNGRKYPAVPDKQKPFDLFESLAGDFKALESSLNSEFSNFNSASRIRPFASQTTSASGRVDGTQKGDWSEETQDTWRRADGMRCTRTVTVTPGGQSVTTRCFRDGRSPGQPRRRRRNYPITTFLTNVDDELNYYFDRARHVFNQWF